MKQFFALIIALVLIFALSACTKKVEAPIEEPEVVNEPVEVEEPETSDADVMTHAEFDAAAVEDKVVVETYVQAKQGWWEDTANIYAQSEDGGYFIYKLGCTEEEYAELAIGTKIRVTGYKSEWSGEIEIVDATYEIIDGNYVAEASDVTDLLGTDDLADYMNEFVSFKGMTVEASEDADGNEAAFLYNYDGSGKQGSDLYFNVSYNGETYNFCVESYLCDASTDVYKAVEALEIGQVIDMEGFLYWYEGANPHITSVDVVG